MGQRLDSQVMAIAIVLGAVAGYVDALGFDLLSGVYTSHVTGNTAHLGAEVIRANWGDAGRYGWAVLMFLAGLMVSAFITATGKRRGFHSTFGVALALEAALLFASPAMRNYYAVAAVLGGSMGIQTVTVTKLRDLRVYTTYMTGNLTKFAEGAVHFAVSGNRTELRHSIVTGAIWIAFLAGAFGGVAAHGEWDRAATVAPAAVIATLAALDFRSPIDPAEELS